MYFCVQSELANFPDLSLCFDFRPLSNALFPFELPATTFPSAQAIVLDIGRVGIELHRDPIYLRSKSHRWHASPLDDATSILATK
jgi:hypothetical protein